MQRGSRTNSRRCSEQATIDSTCSGVLADLGLGSTALESDLVDLGLDDLGLEKALSGGLDENIHADIDGSSGEDENLTEAAIEIAQPSTTPPKPPTSGVFALLVMNSLILPKICVLTFFLESVSI